MKDYVFEVKIMHKEGQEQTFTVITTAGNEDAAKDQLRSLLHFRYQSKTVALEGRLINLIIEHKD